jgi:hypothetical protein
MRHTVFRAALLAAAIASTALAGATSGLLQALRPADALQGAGCVYTDAADDQQLMAVDPCRTLSDCTAVARVRVHDTVQQLDRISSGKSDRYVDPDGPIRIEVSQWVTDPQAPVCLGECEGSFDLAQMRISLGKQTEQLQVKVHCGA